MAFWRKPLFLPRIDPLFATPAPSWDSDALRQDWFFFLREIAKNLVRDYRTAGVSHRGGVEPLGGPSFLSMISPGKKNIIRF